MMERSDWYGRPKGAVAFPNHHPMASLPGRTIPRRLSFTDRVKQPLRVRLEEGCKFWPSGTVAATRANNIKATELHRRVKQPLRVR
jgi:hypothetical protein